MSKCIVNLDFYVIQFKTSFNSAYSLQKNKTIFKNFYNFKKFINLNRYELILSN